MVASALSASVSFSVSSHRRSPFSSLFSDRHSTSSVVSSLQIPHGNSLATGLSSRATGLAIKHGEKNLVDSYPRTIAAKSNNPPIMPAVMTPGGPLDLTSVLLRNRIIFIGQPINSPVAQRVISQLVTLAAIDEDADILVYLNCPGGSTYSVLAIYDCMSWIKPKVGTVCFGVAASQGALLLAGGEKGMRYAMPNARIMVHQPQSGCGGHVEDVRRQVNEAVQSRHKIDKMYAAFTGQPLEKVQQYTERDRFLSAPEALDFGLIDGILETEY
ncbi:ATP-dependent Clp protease proteolytic subunit 6 chloroplastic -like protein [Tripterygium wilfordii]|uniref:ATP-dependent Clp protease proteolytic subunit n=1 Tax=Tripterygium wilfordii TaxID=458696 RepID=A0A7J7BZW5_TRIWF|nr:ATP-dependent Clp protease proteolytic subunit 6, chloroplastic [Tripterygium wilfordii]KAF5727215.1 ATP-dependent Clp protease proteolytic subunit 6 chloroplastic -like protein [Tripterygium wilfordii]